MTDRIRIDQNDLRNVPVQPVARPAPRQGSSARPTSGEVFGSVGPSGGVENTSIWMNSRFTFSLAGLLAGLIGSFLTDGVAGFGRLEAAGEDPPLWMTLLFITSFGGFLAMCVAAIDDLVAGAPVRAIIFGASGFALGIVGSVVATFVGGLVGMLLVAIIASMLDDAPESKLGLVVFAMVFRGPTWLVLGAVIGVVVGGLGRSLRRALLGLLGGAVGGLIGGMIFDPISLITGGLEPGQSATLSRLIGLCVLGAVTGLTIALAEQVARQAWLQIERGRLVGKQFILYRNPTRIGAAYSNDVFLFKDASVQQEHARIVRRGGEFQVEALPGALVRVNGQPVVSRSIRSGDTVQIGETVMRFQTKA